MTQPPPPPGGPPGGGPPGGGPPGGGPPGGGPPGGGPPGGQPPWGSSPFPGPFPGGQPYPGRQPYPGQPYGRQPYPGQPYPGSGKPPRSRGSRIRLRLIALAVVVAAIAGIALLPRIGSGSPRAWLLDNYELVSSEGNALTLRSADDPTQVVDDLTAAWNPADQVVDAAGVFLRYSDLIVAVTPDGEGGSRIEADDEEDGYVRFFPFVAGYWGSPGVGGGGPGFRGGGPGSGK